jgi:alginate O-acetyltransferase complex protein AlgI
VAFEQRTLVGKMAFSSQLFLYGFMPLFFALYYLLPGRYKNAVILGGSLLFYTVGAGGAVLVLVASIFVNHFLALRVAQAPEPRRRAFLVIGIAVNVLSRAYYKYTGFLWQLTGDAAVSIGLPGLPQPPSIALPIGISFFTFQAISYLIDVYIEVTSPARSYFEFATYHSLFPQLIAGPIVRYTEISSEMQKRHVDELALTEGAYRFCLGLGKKLVIADNLGNVVDATFALPIGELDPVRAWIGIFFYAFQLYYDFSGYSDMAIGLGRLLGFHFPENFDQPYRSSSVTEFWRRWHMTLMRWLRDYVFMPLALAGRRRGSLWTAASLGIVFFLCGLWHGAGFTFILYGLYNGALLIIEWLANRWFDWKPSGVPGMAYTFVLVMFGDVLFRAPTLDAAGHYFAALLFLGPAVENSPPVLSYLTPEILCSAALGAFFAFAPLERLGRLRFDRPAVMASQLGFSSVSLVYSLLLLAANSFNPFIYFRF